MGEKFDIATMRRQTTLTAKKYVNAHGFSPAALVQVLSNSTLRKIVKAANTNLYNLRNSITIHRIHTAQLKPLSKNDKENSSHVFLNTFDSGDDKVDIISHDTFCSQLFQDLSLPKPTQEDIKVMDAFLATIGALAIE